MRQSTQPIAIVSTVGSSSSNRRQRSSAEVLNNEEANSSGDEQDYRNSTIRDRPFRHPFVKTSLSNRNHVSMQSTNESESNEDLLMVGSLPSSRRERRFLVSTGGQEVGGYGGIPSTTRLVLAPKAWNPSQRTKSPPPAPLLVSRMDQERGEKISRIPKMALPESLASSLDSVSLRMSYGSLRENSFQRYYHGVGRQTSAEPQSLPVGGGTSQDLFARLRSNNSTYKLNEEDGIINGRENGAANTLPLVRTSSKSSMSALASLLGDYTINDTKPVDSHSNSIGQNITVHEPSIHSGGTWSYSSNHSDLWHLNSTTVDIDHSMVHSPFLSGRDDYSATSLTGLNILESTHNTSMSDACTKHDLLHVDSSQSNENVTVISLPDRPMVDSFYLETRPSDYEGRDLEETFDLDLDR